MLTEKEISQKAISYLREYYRYRDRHPEGYFDAKTSQVTDSGIIADGLITFKKVDGELFISTIEATSINKEEEIRFRRLNRLLAIDALTAAFLLTAFLLLFLYFGKYLVSFYGDYYAYGSLFLLSLFGFFIASWLVLSKFRRYRYIYSIEQFRQYDVDEQWIAFDSIIFPDYGNKYHDELKKQCYKWGIGLLQIKEDSIYPVITPSREGEFGERKKANFFKSGTIIPKLSTKSFGKQIMKYKKGAFNQFFLITSAILVLGFVSYRFYQSSPYHYWDEARMNSQAEIVDDNGPEELNSWVEPDFIIPFREKVEPYLDGGATIFVQQKQNRNGTQPKVFVLTDNTKVKKYQPKSNSNISCKGIPGSTEDDFIIQLGAYKGSKNAKRRVKLLNEAGITSEIYKCGCLGSNDQLNCVIYVHAYASPDKALFKMKSFETSLIKSKISVEEIWLRPVRTL